jgi:thioredoxin 1
MVERLLITAVILISLGGLSLGWCWYKSRLIRSIQPIETSNGVPTLLWFTADYCVPCKVQQAPIIDKLATELGQEVVIKKIDVSQNPKLASHYKVLTLPTTIVLDETGQVAHINYGVTSQTKLAAQLM